MNRPPSPAIQDAHDQLLADLLGQLTEERQQGREPDLEGRLRLHPEVAEELLRFVGRHSASRGLRRCPSHR